MKKKNEGRKPETKSWMSDTANSLCKKKKGRAEAEQRGPKQTI